MPILTDEEADALNELLTKTTPELTPGFRGRSSDTVWNTLSLSVFAVGARHLFDIWGVGGKAGGFGAKGGPE
jgi:hypothetical protein